MSGQIRQADAASGVVPVAEGARAAGARAGLTPTAPLAAPEAQREDHDTDSFDSGEPTPDIWLARRARANQISGASRTYVVCRERDYCRNRFAGHQSLVAHIPSLFLSAVGSAKPSMTAEPITTASPSEADPHEYTL